MKVNEIKWAGIMYDPESDKAQSEMFYEWLKVGGQRILADFTLPDLKAFSISYSHNLPYEDLNQKEETNSLHWQYYFREGVNAEHRTYTHFIL